MKAYLFIETGEVRKVRGGESYLFYGGINIRGEDSQTYYPYPILTRHEIEIPSWCKDLRVVPDWGHEILSVPIPRPKKKVQKWRWKINKPPVVWETERHHTEDEMKTYMRVEDCSKIWGSEIEVEE